MLRILEGDRHGPCNECVRPGRPSGGGIDLGPAIASIPRRPGGPCDKCHTLRRDTVMTCPASTTMTARAGRVLIVDDEPNVRFVFRRAGSLGLHGGRGDERDLGPGTDQEAPRGRGPASTSRCPRWGAWKSSSGSATRATTHVVIVTAHGSVPDAVAAMKLGAIDFLAKPLTPEALRRVVSEVIERHARPRSGPYRLRRLNRPRSCSEPPSST